MRTPRSAGRGVALSGGVATVVGSFWGTVDFGAVGGSSNDEHVEGLALQGGEVWITGSFEAETRLGTFTLRGHSSTPDLLVARVGADSGRFSAAAAAGGPGDDLAHAVALSGRGGSARLTLAGAFSARATFGPVTLRDSASLPTLLLASLDAAGRFTWAQKVQSSGPGGAPPPWGRRWCWTAHGPPPWPGASWGGWGWTTPPAWTAGTRRGRTASSGG